MLLSSFVLDFSIHKNRQPTPNDNLHYLMAEEYSMLILLALFLIIKNVLRFVKVLWTLQMLLRKNCPDKEFFWSVFFRIWTEYADLLSKSLYLVQIRENTDQKNSALYLGTFYAVSILKSLTSWSELKI